MRLGEKPERSESAQRQAGSFAQAFDFQTDPAFHAFSDGVGLIQSKSSTRRLGPPDRSTDLRLLLPAEAMRKFQNARNYHIEAGRSVGESARRANGPQFLPWGFR